MGPAQGEGLLTGGALRLVGRRGVRPVGGGTRHGTIGEHLRAQAGQPGVEFQFDVAEGGAGVVSAPLPHSAEDFGAQGLPAVVVCFSSRIPLKISVLRVCQRSSFASAMGSLQTGKM